jgi:hypothetical protein
LQAKVDITLDLVEVGHVHKLVFVQLPHLAGLEFAELAFDYFQEASSYFLALEL